MKYKVTVEQLVQNEDSKYPDKETIFEQTIDGEFLDLQAVIQATNRMFYTNKEWTPDISDQYPKTANQILGHK